MSNIFITDIVGTIGIPSNDVQLAAATATLDSLLSGVANLTYDRVLGWVEDQAGPDGAEGIRTLNCMVEKFTYIGDECPSEANVDALGAAIEAALEGDPSITSIGQQQYHLFQAGAYFLWQRDAAGGFLYPTITTDDIAVGGHVAPAGKWFDDGDLVLGDSTMVGVERLRVAAGGVRVEKSDSGAVPGIYVHAYSNHPAAQQAAYIDVDVNSIGLDIDSGASSKPLINLTTTNANTRGDIAFGTARTSDALSPFEGDLWYNSTDNYYRYYDGAATQTLARLADIYWGRNSGSGYVYTITATDDIVVGGNAAPTGKWFDNSNLVLGATAMSGAEKFRVVAGGVRVEKSDAGAVPGIYVNASGSHPAANQAVFIDVDVNSIGLDIDSGATGKPLISLLPINTNSRGDIAFGTARTTNASAPSTGDLWYHSTDKYFRYYDGTVNRTIATLEDLAAGFGGNAANAASDGASSTSSTTFQQKLRLTVNNVPAGTYRIGVSFLWAYSNAARDFYAQVQVDDTTTVWYMGAKPADGGSAEDNPACGFAYVTFGSTANHNIDLDYRATNVVDTAYIELAKLEFWRVS